MTWALRMPRVLYGERGVQHECVGESGTGKAGKGTSDEAEMMAGIQELYLPGDLHH